MAMLPDEKYPDMSLHPTNSAQVLYGTLQKGNKIQSHNQFAQLGNNIIQKISYKYLIEYQN